MEKIIHCLSFEFLLKERPNGGSVILVRSVAMALQLYFLAIVVKQTLSTATDAFSCLAIRAVVADTLPWFGAVFAGVYAALYSRFSAQWTYLADLYNQMMSTTAQCDKSKETTDVLAYWQAGFIEDAEELHLATKPMFASLIKEMLKESDVRHAFEAHAPGHKARLEQLEARIEKAVATVHARYYPK